MVVQLAEATEQTGVVAQPRAGNCLLHVEGQAAGAAGQPIAGQVRTHPIQRASDKLRSLVEGPGICDAYLRGFVGAQ
eukprot:5251599-Alexandrium_andersonii.AAC.1